jgi:hypothetical protein
MTERVAAVCALWSTPHQARPAARAEALTGPCYPLPQGERGEPGAFASANRRRWRFAASYMQGASSPLEGEDSKAPSQYRGTSIAPAATDPPRYWLGWPRLVRGAPESAHVG